jgi:hypothetical protein
MIVQSVPSSSTTETMELSEPKNLPFRTTVDPPTTLMLPSVSKDFAEVIVGRNYNEATSSTKGI